MNKETLKCKVAAIQMVSTNSVDTNLATMYEQVRLAANKGAELVVLPEYFSFIGQSEDEKVKWAEVDNYELSDGQKIFQERHIINSSANKDVNKDPAIKAKTMGNRKVTSM